MQPKSQLGYILRDLFSGKDNYSLDLGRILWALGVLQFMIISGVSILLGKSFDYITWSAAFGGLLATGGAALKIKESTEPNKELINKEDE